VKPTKYELLVESGVLYLRGHAPDTEKGWFNVEAVRRANGSALAGLRRQGEKLARRNGVPFIDRTLGGAP
jgi:hypothetical protein